MINPRFELARRRAERYDNMNLDYTTLARTAHPRRVPTPDIFEDEAPLPAPEPAPRRGRGLDRVALAVVVCVFIGLLIVRP